MTVGIVGVYLIRSGELCVHHSGCSLYVTRYGPLVFRHAELHIVCLYISIGKAEEELYLTAHGEFVVNLVGVAESEFYVILRTNAELRHVVLLLTANRLHKAEE